MKLSLRTANPNDLLRNYVSAAILHAEASANGDYRKANSQHDLVQAIYRELKSRGETAQRLVLGLLDHPAEAVRGWAAFHALEFAPQEGEVVLEALSKTSGIWGLDSQMTLKEWRKGTLKFPS